MAKIAYESLYLVFSLVYLQAFKTFSKKETLGSGAEMEFRTTE